MLGEINSAGFLVSANPCKGKQISELINANKHLYFKPPSGEKKKVKTKKTQLTAMTNPQFATGPAVKTIQ
jgi:hypothetical protein